MKKGWLLKEILKALSKSEDGCAMLKDLVKVHPRRTLASVAYSVSALERKGLVKTEYVDYKKRVCLTDLGRRRAAEYGF